MTQKVSFTKMEDGSAQEYLFLHELEAQYAQALPQRILQALKQQEHDSLPGYQITRLEHALQTATRAERDGADDETVVCALLHDIGDSLAPWNHSELAAAILQPYVSQRNYWIIKHHGLFQSYYYAHHLSQDRFARERYADHPYYQDCVDFCHRWDQTSFDPDYHSFKLEHFADRVHRILTREPFNHQ